MAEVVHIRNAAPALTDIPGMLRRLADQIEAGEQGDVQSAILLLPSDGDYPRVFGWGDVEGDNHPALQCLLAQTWLLNHIVERA